MGSVSAGTTKTWNILSLDGGGIRGLITATVVDYMEGYSYRYARDAYCIPARDNEQLSLSEIFDMVAGTSTGSLLATTIVFPDKSPNPQFPGKNKYFAETAISIYADKASSVFKLFELSIWGRILGTIIFTLVGALLGLYIGFKMYHNNMHEETMASFKQYIK